jgi:hypothetical protein
MAAMRIALDELVMALEDNSGLVEWYLDGETGEVLRLSDALLGESDEELAARIEAGPDRYHSIEPLPPSAGWRRMADFVETVPDAALRSRLESALHGKKPFRAFKDMLLDSPAERERWFRFKDAFYRAQALAWLEAEGIEAELTPPAEAG